MIQRSHLQRVIEQPQSGAKIYECAVRILIAVDPTAPIAGFNRLLNVVATRINSWAICRGDLRPDYGGQNQCQGKNRNLEEEVTRFHRGTGFSYSLSALI